MNNRTPSTALALSPKAVGRRSWLTLGIPQLQRWSRKGSTNTTFFIHTADSRLSWTRPWEQHRFAHNTQVETLELYSSIQYNLQLPLVFVEGLLMCHFSSIMLVQVLSVQLNNFFKMFHSHGQHDLHTVSIEHLWDMMWQSQTRPEEDLCVCVCGALGPVNCKRSLRPKQSAQ